MKTSRMLTLAVLLGVGFLALTQGAYKRDYGRPREKNPSSVGRSPRASYPNRQPEIPALYSAPKPQKLQQQPDQSLNDVEFSDPSSATTEIPFETDQIVIDAADEGAELPESEEEGTSEDYQQQETATERSAPLQEDPALNEFPTSPSAALTEDNSSFFRRKPAPNSYLPPQQPNKPEKQVESRADEQSQYLPPVQTPNAKNNGVSQYTSPSNNGGYDSNPKSSQQAPNPPQQRRVLDQQQIETKPYRNEIQVQAPPPENRSQNQNVNGRDNSIQQNIIPSREYLPHFENNFSQENFGGYNNFQPITQQPQSNQLPQQQRSEPNQHEQPRQQNQNQQQQQEIPQQNQNQQQQQHQLPQQNQNQLPQQNQQPQQPLQRNQNVVQPSLPLYPPPQSQNEIPNFSNGKKEDSEQLQLEGLSESIVDADLLRRVQQIIEQHEKQQKELLDNLKRENDNVFSQTNRQTTTGGYEHNGRAALQQQQQFQRNPSAPLPPSPLNNGPRSESFDAGKGSGNGKPESFVQPGYYNAPSQNYPDPQSQHPQHANVNPVPFGGEFRNQPVQQQQLPQHQPNSNERISINPNQFGYGGYPASGEAQQRGFPQEAPRFQHDNRFREVSNSIFSQEEPQITPSQEIYTNQRRNQNGNEHQTPEDQTGQEQRTSQLNNYGIGSGPGEERPEGKSVSLNQQEPDIEYQKAVLSTHFVQTQPDPAFQVQQQQQQQQHQENSREYLPPAPKAPSHSNSQFSSPAQLGAPQSVEQNRAALNADHHPRENINNFPPPPPPPQFQFHQASQLPFEQPQPQQLHPQPQQLHPQPQPFYTTLSLNTPNNNEQHHDFANVNVNAGLIVEGQQPGSTITEDGVVYGVPSSNLILQRQDETTGDNTQTPVPYYPTGPNNNPLGGTLEGRNENLVFGVQPQLQQQQQQQGFVQSPFQFEYLPPTPDQQRASFRTEIEQLNSNSFQYGVPSQQHNNNNNNNNNNDGGNHRQVVSQSEESSSQNLNGQFGEKVNNNFIRDNTQAPANPEANSYGFEQTPYIINEQQPAESFQGGRPGASFVNNNADIISNNNNGNPTSSFTASQKGNEIVEHQEHQQQQQSNETPRPIYGVPLAPVISIDSGEDLADFSSPSPSLPLSSFFNNENTQPAQGFLPYQTQSINNNYLTPQARQSHVAETTPFDTFSQESIKQLQELSTQHQHQTPVYGLPQQQQQPQTLVGVTGSNPNNNNRNGESNGYGSSRNDNSAQLNEIPVVSNTVSVPTRDYAPPTSYSYSNRVETHSLSPSTNSYSRIRKHLSSSISH